MMGMVQRLLWRWLGAYRVDPAQLDAMERLFEEEGRRLAEAKECGGESPCRVGVHLDEDAVLVALEACIEAKTEDREWLLWGVGMIAQSMGGTPEGPDA